MLSSFPECGSSKFWDKLFLEAQTLEYRPSLMNSVLYLPWTSQWCERTGRVLLTLIMCARNNERHPLICLLAFSG